MLHQFPFCAFETPDGWQPAPGAGAVSTNRTGLVASAMVARRWDGAATTAAEWGERLRSGLDADADTVRVLEAVPQSSGGPEQGFRVVHAATDRRGRSSRTTHVCLTCGPLACLLTVLDLAPPADEVRGLTDAVARTFRLVGTEPLARATRTSVLDSEPPPVAPRFGGSRPAPRLGFEVPIPEGWTAGEDGDATLLSRQGAEIRIARLASDQADAGAWLGVRLTALATEAGHEVRAWDEASLPDGRPLVSIRHAHEQRASSWVKPTLTEGVDVFTGGAAPLEWRLRVADGWFPEMLAVLAGAVAGARALPPPWCETRIAEPWLTIVLDGLWTAPAPGVHRRQGDEPVTLQLGVFPCPTGLERARPVMGDVIESLRAGIGLVEVLKEDEAFGAFKGLEAYRFAFDARLHGAETRSTRGAGVLAEKKLYSVVVKGQDPKDVDRLFLAVLEAMRVPGMMER